MHFFYLVQRQQLDAVCMVVEIGLRAQMGVCYYISITDRPVRETHHPLLLGGGQLIAL